jgi:site-specific recombinase XerD
MVVWHPRDMAEREIGECLTELAVRGRVSASTQNQALAALLFLYRDVLGIPMQIEEGVVRVKRARRLPEVMTREEVAAVIDAMTGTPRLAALMLYGSGLRLQECVMLRVKDVDFAERTVMVRGGKGDKDRRTVLADGAVAGLEPHLAQVRRLHARDVAAGQGGGRATRGARP